MHYDLEVNAMRVSAPKNNSFEGAPLDLSTDEFVAEEPSLLDAIVAALRPLTTLVRRQAEER